MKKITEQPYWDEFAPLLDQGLFLQSYEQKKLYEKLGQKTWLLEEWNMKGDLVRSLVTKIVAKRATFLYLPYGPMVTNGLSVESLKPFFDQLIILAREEKASFIRISPFWKVESASLLRQLGFRPSPIHMLAETLWLLDLRGKTEEQLMMGMEKKHRNLVRRAEKEGVTIHASATSAAVERFIDLHSQTVDRHGFTPYPKGYFKSQVELFANRNQVLVFEAFWQDQLLASAIIMYFGKVAAYHHGASSSNPEHRKIPASYLLQWEAIREALRRSCDRYNFWGIAPGENKRHPFYGITHFKTGFGGRRFDLVPCHDLVLKPQYYVNWLIEKLRKWRRGF